MKRLAVEITMLALVGVGLTILFNGIIYPAIDMPSPGPAPVRTVILLVLATFFLRRAELNWADVGLFWRTHWWKLGLAVIGFFAAKLLLQSGTDWIRTTFAFPPNDYAFFAHLEGNVGALAIWIAVAWIAGGFAEEMVLRGFVMQRIAKVLGKTKGAWVFALIFQALIFGLGHAYIGAGGVLFGTLSALFYGAIVLICKGSLWPAILVHGLWDTLGFLVIYHQGIPGG